MCTGMRKRFLIIENGGVAVSLYRMEYKNQTGFYRKEGSLPREMCFSLSKRDTAMPLLSRLLYLRGSGNTAIVGMLFCECSFFLPRHAD